MRMKVWGEMSGERHLVGTLEMIPGREEQFSYAESYLESEVAQPLSVRLPLREEPFPARQTRAFFRNLLPEEGALAAVAKTLEVKSSSYLKVLNALGSECIGALVLESADEREDDPYGYDPLSREELGRAFEAGAEGVAKLQEEAKLSLAGAQSKMGLYVDRSSGPLPQYFLPQGTAASTHIVKAANRRFEQLSENEYYCLRLAEAAGLFVPECYLDTIGDQPLFVIERFDRMVLPEDDRRAGGGVRRVQRLHQEDFCQVLSLLPERKYEKGGRALCEEGAGCALRVLFGSGARYRGVRAPAGGERRSRKLRRAPQEPHRASGRRLVVVCIGACIRHRLDGGVRGPRSPYGHAHRVDQQDRRGRPRRFPRLGEGAGRFAAHGEAAHRGSLRRRRRDGECRGERHGGRLGRAASEIAGD